MADQCKTNRDHLTTEAADLYARIGPTNRRPKLKDYTEPPAQDRWERDLGGQTRLTVTATEAIAVVREGWSKLTARDDPRRTLVESPEGAQTRPTTPDTRGFQEVTGQVSGGVSG